VATPYNNRYRWTPRTFKNASYALSGNDLTLMSGQTLIIYIVNPDSISVNDIGVTVGLTVFTSNAQYYKEANVEST
jgi:DNA-binding transcriptional regulator of glucitol operon